MRRVEDLTFPVLIFYRGYKVDIQFTPEPLTYNNRLGLKSDPYRDTFIVDSSGNRYEILCVRKLKFAYPYISILFINPNYKLEFDLGDPEPLPGGELRDIVLQALHKEGSSKRRIYRLVQQATTVQAVMSAVEEGLFGKGGYYPQEEDC